MTMTPDAAADISVRYFGRERVPVIVLDNFVSFHAQLVMDASMLAYQPIGPYYPGVRAVVSSRLVTRFLSGLELLLADTFGLTTAAAVVESYYSLVTTAPADLAPIQRLPHFDSVDMGRIALLHYLSSAASGGTAFYRHRTTGFERVTADRMAEYEKTLQADIARTGLPKPAYISGDTPVFDQIGHIAARYNRAIVYPGNCLHCADIPADMVLSADPAVGRLTVNTFLQAAIA
jgi:hypothetical protein